MHGVQYPAFKRDVRQGSWCVLLLAALPLVQYRLVSCFVVQRAEMVVFQR